MKRIKSSNVAKIFILTLIIIGILFGIIYFIMQSDLNKNLIAEKIIGLENTIKNTHQNMILPHLIIIITLVFLSYSIIGMPLILFYLFYECTSLGFMLAAFYSTFKIKGILFGLLFILLSKLIFILCLIYISYIALKITKKLLRVLIFKENDSLYLHLKNLFLKLGITIGVTVAYDLFLYFFANKILTLFLGFLH